MESGLQFAAQERTECRAFGTVRTSEVQPLQELLVGLAGTSGQPFQHHEVVLKLAERATELVHLVQTLDSGDAPTEGSRPKGGSKRWLVRRETVNTRGAIKDLAVSVRIVNEIPMSGIDVLGFWGALGFVHEQESLRTGVNFSIATTVLPVQVSVYRLQRLTKRGDVLSAVDISQEHKLVEVVCQFSGGNHLAGVDAIGKLQDMLRPLICLQKG